MRMQVADSGGSVPEFPALRHHRHRLTRRAFLGSTAGAAGAIVGGSLLQPAAALAGSPHTDNSANPTASTFTLTNPVTLQDVTFSLAFFGPGLDASSITDFNGFVGVADVQGNGTATNADGSQEPLLFDTDMRFMTGTYVGKDGRNYKGSFGFV